MLQKILFFLLFFNITSLHAMITPFKELPKDIRQTIFNCIITSKPKEAIPIITHLAQTFYYTDTNIPKTSDRLIKIIAQKYYCSHESISKFLHTEQAKQRYKLQLKLKKLCCYEQDYNLSAKLDELISKGVDLEFTYNHDCRQKTALMIASNYNNNMFEYLLQLGADINGYNSHGMTMLHLATHRPKRYFIKFIQQPGIAFNQQDKHHKTALLYCIIKRKDPADAHFITMIRQLLEAGTDPESANINGLSPLVAAQTLKKDDEKNLIIQLITDAIERKHAATAISS